jgi:lysophospholipase L1-like esterase
LRRSFFVKFLLFILILPFVLEVSVRIFAPQQLIRLDNIYTADEGLGRIPLSNLDMIVNTGERDVRYSTDDKGFRIGTSKDGKPSLRILALGDSFTVAMQVEYEQSFVGLLEASLSTKLAQTVYIDNAASANFDVNGYHIRMNRELERQQYDLVLVFIYMGNDITNSVVEAYPPVYPSPPQTLRMPKNLSRAELTQAILYPINNALETSSHLFILFKDRASAYLARFGLTARYFPEHLLRTNASDQRWEITGQILAAMRDEAKQRNLPIMFVLLPSTFQVDPAYLEWARQAFGITSEEIDIEQPSRLLTAIGQQQQLDMVDLQPAFRKAHDEGAVLFGTVDSHLSPAGHELVLRTIEPHIIELLKLRSK